MSHNSPGAFSYGNLHTDSSRRSTFSVDSSPRHRLREQLSSPCRAVLHRRSGRARRLGRRDRAHAGASAATAATSRRSSRPSSSGGRRPPGRSRLRRARRSEDRRDRDGTAGRTLRRSAVHAAEGPDGASSSPTRCRGSTGAGRRGVLGRGRRPRLGRGALVYGARRAARTANRRPSRLNRPAIPSPVAQITLDASIQLGHRRARAHSAADGIHAGAVGRSSPGLRTGHRHGRCVRAVDRARARPARPDRLRRIGSRVQAAGGRRLRARAVDRRSDGRLASASGADMVARGYHAQVHAQDDSVALFRLDGARRVIRQQDGALVVGDQRYATDAHAQGRQRPTLPGSAPACCCVRSCRTRSSRPPVTSQAPTSWRISDS